MDTWQEVDNKLERAIYLTQWLEKNGAKKESIQHYVDTITELKEILIFLRGLNND